MKAVDRCGEGLLDVVSSVVHRLERLGYDLITIGELLHEATMRWTVASHTSTRAGRKDVGMSVNRIRT